MGVYPLCIYTWHRCAPSTEGVRSVLSYIYIPVWRRLLLLLIFDMKGFSRAATGKDGAKGNQIPTPSFYNSNPVSNNLLYLGSRWSTEKGRKVHRYGEENGFGCFAPTDIRTSDR